MKQLISCVALVCSFAAAAFAQSGPTEPPQSKKPPVGLIEGDIVKDPSGQPLTGAVDQARADEGIATRRDALADFKQGAGLGITVALGSKEESIENAVIIDNKVVVTRRAKDQPRAALEVHQLFTTNVFTTSGRRAAVDQLVKCGQDRLDCPMVGIGPFAVVQTGDNDALSSVGLGVMIGARTDPRQGASFNIGVGVSFDARTKRLADGFVEGQAPPSGATVVTFSEKSHRRLLLALSFAF